MASSARGGLFFDMREEKRWATLGETHPYYAVCTEPRFRSGRMDGDDIAAFFASGERDMAATIAAVRSQVGADFHPATALDFGCGVGRLTIPLARESRRVVGVDISPSMLREAARNCERRGVTNVEFVSSSQFFDDSRRFSFDFVHSFIVFQHIDPDLGLRFTDRILERLSVGGLGALHYTYGYGAGASRFREALHRARRLLPPVNMIANLMRSHPMLEPVVPMFRYDLTALSGLFRSRGCTVLHSLRTDHGGYLGAVFLLRKEPASQTVA